MSGHTSRRNASRDRDLALDGARAKRRSGHRQPLQHDVAPVELDAAAAQERDDDEPAFEREAFQVLLDVVAADHVEHDVDAALAGDARDLGDEILRAVIDRMRGAHRRDRTSSCRRCRRSTITVAPKCRAIWIAVSPMPLVPPWISTVSPRRSRPRSTRLFQTVKNVSGRLAASITVKPRGDRQAESRGRRAVLRVTAARRQRANGIADAPVLHAFAAGDDACPRLRGR